MSRPRRWPLVAAAVLTVAGLSACTLGSNSGDVPHGDEGPDAASSPTASAPAGPTPEELSSQLLEAHVAGEQAVEVLATVTADIAPEGTVTAEVTDLRRIEDGTVLALRFSSPDGQGKLSPTVFKDGDQPFQWFGRTVMLESADDRFLPLQFDDSRLACACAYVANSGSLAGQEQTYFWTFPPLPDDVGVVDVKLGTGPLAFDDVPVS